MTEGELAIGLYMNASRVHAQRILGQSMAIGVALRPSAYAALLDEAGVDKAGIAAATLSDWRSMSQAARGAKGL